MDGDEVAPLELSSLLAAVESAPPVAGTQVVGEALARSIGAREVDFLIAELSGRSLVRLGPSSGSDGASGGLGAATRVPLRGTPHGRALARQAVEVVAEGGTMLVLAPVTNRGHAIGLLELRLPALPDNRVIDEIAVAAHALSYVLIVNSRYTDLFEWGQRSAPLSLAAEIQHRLLPNASTLEAEQFTLASWLEPAGEVAGDSYDFSLDSDRLHLSITDAMGHSLEAALLATLLVGALRNARRAGCSLEEQAQRGHAALVRFSRDDQFVTGQLVRVDLGEGLAEIVNAGHPPPLRVRDGQIERLRLANDAPFGAVAETAYRPQPVTLRTGDRLVFLTDGMLERNAADLDVDAAVRASAGLHPREAVQHLTEAVLDASGGVLQDDAAVLCLDWHGGPPRQREARQGADR